MSCPFFPLSHMENSVHQLSCYCFFRRVMLYIKDFISNGKISNTERNWGKPGRRMNLFQLLTGHSDLMGMPWKGSNHKGPQIPILASLQMS